MDRAYFRAHTDECQAEMARTARRGQRRADRARARLRAIERGDAPFPGEGGDDAEDEEDDEDEEDG